MEPTGFALGSFQAIIQLAGVIKRHSTSFHEIYSQTAFVESRAIRASLAAKRITNFGDDPGVCKDLLSHMLSDLDETQNRLQDVNNQLTRHSSARILLNAPVLLRKIDEADRRLAQVEQTLQTVGIICSALSCQIAEIRHIVLATVAACLSVSTSSNQHQQIMLALESQLKAVSSTFFSSLSSQTDSETALAMGLSDFEPRVGGSVRRTENPEKIQSAARYFRKACRLGKKEAYRYLGDIFYDGKGVEGCFRTAADIYKEGIAHGDTASMFRLAMCYEYGHGVVQCNERTVQLFTEASANGCGESMFALGDFKLNGKMVAVNHRAAVKLLKKSASLNVIGAKGSLAICYEKGIGFERNAQMSFELLREAFDQGSMFAVTDLATCYDSGNGTEQNPEEATKVWEELISYGTWHSTFYKSFHGLRLLRGIGAEKNVERGKSMILESAKFGESNAYPWYALAECYRYGLGFRRDLNQAKYYYRKASLCSSGIRGIVGSYEALGEMFEIGEGVLLDIRRSMKYYKEAADRLSQKGQWKSAHAFESGIGQSKNVHRAVHYFRLCANSGHLEAQRKTFMYYMKGHGLERSRVHARKMMKDAAMNGNKDAKRWLLREDLRGTLTYLRGWSL